MTDDSKKDGKIRVNILEEHLPVEPKHPYSLSDEMQTRLTSIQEEFARSFQFIQTIEKSITVFGSTRFQEGNVHYEQARRIARRLAEEGFSVVTGGGPGIMEAANRGAKEGNGRSIGFNIELPEAQNLNDYVVEKIGFHYFFTRKVALSFSAELFLFFPGGFGTLDEFFEVVTLVQTRKMTRVPIVLVGRDYWAALDAFIKEHILERHKAISPEDRNIYTITNDDDEVVEIAKKAPMR